MELTYRRAQLLELSRILAQCFANIDRYEDFGRVDKARARRMAADGAAC